MWYRHAPSRPSSYAIIDIPESLFFAETALCLEFGDAVGYFDGKDPGTPIVLVPICHLSSFSRASDLVVNTGSMQEMTDEWIEFYMSWLDQHDAKYFYSLNYAASPLSDLGEGRTFWGPRPSTAWSTRLLCFDIPMLRLKSGRDFLEAIYEKSPAKYSLDDWSANRGFLISRPVYLEGLDLLRQSLNPADATDFTQRVLRQMPYVPKELYWIAEWLERAGHPIDLEIRNRLSDALDTRFRKP
jgi:hypothetical protein